MALAGILLCWVAVRAAVWQNEGAGNSPALPGRIPAAESARDLAGALPVPAAIRPVPVLPLRGAAVAAYSAPLAPAVAPPILRGSPLSEPAGPPSPTVFATVPSTPPVAPGLAGGHAMMWLAVVGRMPAPETLLAAMPVRPVVPAARVPSAVPRDASPTLRRWSADAWALVRGGGGVGGVGGGGGAGPSIATYGGSQVGAVLRYRLAPGNAHRPAAYVRASAALNGSGEREVAAGLSARPIARLPVVVAAEGRAGRLGRRSAVRPAIMAVTELAPMELPHHTRAEFYLQGGYVGGAGATPFIDGQLRIDKRVAQVGPIELRAGAAAWGGAQRGAGRLDVGPSATLGIAKGAASARVGVDWRFRIGGAAEPASGPALTVSAGF